MNCSASTRAIRPCGGYLEYPFLSKQWVTGSSMKNGEESGGLDPKLWREWYNIRYRLSLDMRTMIDSWRWMRCSLGVLAG